MTPTTFHNYADTDLADAIGSLDAECKEMTDRLKAAKAEFTSRGMTDLDSGRFRITASQSARWTLDSKAVKQEMGEDWCAARSNMAMVTTVRVQATQQPVAMAAE